MSYPEPPDTLNHGGGGGGGGGHPGGHGGGQPGDHNPHTTGQAAAGGCLMMLCLIGLFICFALSQLRLWAAL